MLNTTKGNRLQIAILGRVNTGKSSLLNYIIGQDISIISSIPGTTTDIVEKAMELLPVGPVLFLDTGGIDDSSDLGILRIKKTKKIYERADVIILVIEPNKWGEYEEEVVLESKKNNIPLLLVINKIDLESPSLEFINKLKVKGFPIIFCSIKQENRREYFLNELKKNLLEICPQDFFNPKPLVKDLVNPGDTVLLVIPIDSQAPKGRLILPQVETIRELLDNDCIVVQVKEDKIFESLKKLNYKVNLVICDSQVVDKMCEAVSDDILCTTFSILMCRQRANLVQAVEGVKAIKNLQKNDKILIAEACTHHPLKDDIGRIKIPYLLKKYTGNDLEIDIFSGRDYPADLSDYKLIIHCGSCMLTRKETLLRYQKASTAGVPITNYGVCISFLRGVLEKVLTPFPDALNVFLAGGSGYTQAKSCGSPSPIFSPLKKGS